MVLHIWSAKALLYTWLIALAIVILAQLVSAMVMPRSWEFFWILPHSARPSVLLPAVAQLWRALWAARPLEAFSLTVLLTALGATIAWLGARLWYAGHHAFAR